MNFKEFIHANGSPLSLKKEEHVFHQGDEDDSLYFVASGLLKAYYLSAEGKETIKSFIKVGNTIGSLSAAYRGLPCAFNLVALEDVNLIQFQFAKLQAVARESHEVAKHLMETLLQHSMKKEQREYEFLMLQAEDRYISFKQREPELAEKLTQNDIARYLGITPVALSRIKNRR